MIAKLEGYVESIYAIAKPTILAIGRGSKRARIIYEFAIECRSALDPTLSKTASFVVCAKIINDVVSINWFSTLDELANDSNPLKNDTPESLIAVLRDFFGIGISSDVWVFSCDNFSGNLHPV